MQAMRQDVVSAEVAEDGAQPTEPADSTARHAGSRFGRWLALVVVGGFAWRLVVITLSRGEKVTGDGYEWGRQGNLNASGHWFVSAFTLQPDALRPPGWAMVLTVWAWLGQHSWFRQQILACAIGAATVAVIGIVGRRLAGDRAGLLSAGLAAVYPGLWVFERPLLSEVILLPGVAVMILLAYRFRDRPSLRGAVVLGAMCGVLAMIRSEQILVLPLLVLPLVFGREQSTADDGPDGWAWPSSPCWW